MFLKLFWVADILAIILYGSFTDCLHADKIQNVKFDRSVFTHVTGGKSQLNKYKLESIINNSHY